MSFTNKYDTVEYFRKCTEICGRGSSGARCKKCKDKRCSTVFIGKYGVYLSQRIYATTIVRDDLPAEDSLAFLYEEGETRKYKEYESGIHSSGSESIKGILKAPLNLLDELLETREKDSLAEITMSVDEYIEWLEEVDETDASMDKSRVSIFADDGDVFCHIEPFKVTKSFNINYKFSLDNAKGEGRVELNSYVFSELLKLLSKGSDDLIIIKKIKDSPFVSIESSGLNFLLYENNENYDSR